MGIGIFRALTRLLKSKSCWPRGQDAQRAYVDEDRVVNWGADAIGTSCTWLQRRLEAEGVRVHPDSRLARGLEAVANLEDESRHPGRFRLDCADSAYAFWTQGVGIDFLAKALHRAWRLGLRPPASFWKSLASGEPNVFYAANSSTERNAVWELLAASLCTTFCDDVAFEEPDVTCTYRGKKVNVAIKVVYSERKLRERILEGFEQSTNHGSDIDIVFVNVVGLLPQVALLEQSTAEHFDSVTRAAEWALARAHEWSSGSDLNVIHRKLEERASRPVTVAYFMPMLLTIDDDPAPLFYVHCPLTTEGADYSFARELLRTCNNTLGYRVPDDMSQETERLV